MSAKKVRLPSAIVTNEAGIDDSEEIFGGNTSDLPEDEHTSAIISDVFETDVEVDRKTDIDPTLPKDESVAREGASPPFEASSKSPTSMASDELGKTQSDAESYSTIYQQSRRTRAALMAAAETKKPIDYSKRENNVSIKFLEIHQGKMRQWRNYTLETLINQQDCAVEAVKLERLLRIDRDTSGRKSGRNKKTGNPYVLETTDEKRRLYDLLKY